MAVNPTDGTPVGPMPPNITVGEKDPTSIQLAKDMRTKRYGKDVRETMARMIEWTAVLNKFLTTFYENTDRQNNQIYQQFVDVMDEMTKTKDYYSLPEIASARRGYSSLMESMNNLAFNMFNINLGKITPNMVSDELLAQIAGNAPVLSVVGDGSITTVKIADYAVDEGKLSPMLQSYLGGVSKEGILNLVGTVTLPAGTTRFNNIPSTVSGAIDSISINVAKAGTAKIKVLRKVTETNFQTISVREVNITSTGIVNLKPNTDYSPIEINQGDYLAFHGITAEIKYSMGGSAYFTVADTYEGAINNFASNDLTLDINYTVPIEGQLIKDVDNLKVSASENRPIAYDIGNTDIPTASMISAVEKNTRIDATPIESSGELSEVTFRTGSNGEIKIKFFEKNDDVISFKDEVVINAKIGHHTYRKGVDYEQINIEKGWLIGFYSESNSPKVPFSTIKSGTNSYTIVDTDLSGQATSFVSAVYSLLISAKVTYGLPETKSDLDRLNSVVMSMGSDSFKPNPTILDDDFNADTLPTYWTNNGFTLNDGLTFSGTGGLSKVSYARKYSTSDNQVSQVYFTPNTAMPDIALYKRDFNNSGFASIFRLDGVTKKLIFYRLGTPNDSTLQPVLKESTLTIPIIAGRKYILEVERRTMQYTHFRLIDTITLETQEIINDYVESGVFLMNKGYTGVMAFGGDFKVNRVRVGSRDLKEVQLAIYGDSFIEGATVINYGMENRYADRLKAKLNGSVHINGSGGERTAGLLAKCPHDFEAVKAKYTLLAIGTNDTSFSTYQSNIEELIGKVEAIGSIPILITLAPRGDTDKAAFNQSVNNFVRNSGYMYVDIAVATSLNYDGKTFDQNLFLGDKVHPNVEGHDRIYRRCLIDIPEVFDGHPV